MTNHRQPSHTYDHLTDLQVAQYVEALLDAEPSRIDPMVRNHVEACLKCKSDVLGLYSLRHNTGQTFQPAASNDSATLFKKIRRNSWFQIAAVFLIVIGISAVSYYMKDSGQPTQTSTIASQATGVDSTKQTRNYATMSRFDESPNLEDLLHSSMRSTQIKILSPPDGFNAKNEIDFHWTSGKSQTYFLKILDNKEEVVQQDTIHGNSFVMKDVPPPGLYYWKLENQSDLLHLGKFIVRR